LRRLEMAQTLRLHFSSNRVRLHVELLPVRKSVFVPAHPAPAGTYDVGLGACQSSEIADPVGWSRGARHVNAWKRSRGVLSELLDSAAELLLQLSLDTTGRHAGNKPALERQED
jgi:hypothetical protein